MQVIYNYTYIAPLALLHQLSTSIGMLLFVMIWGVGWWVLSGRHSRTKTIIMRAFACPFFLLFFGLSLFVGYERGQDWWQMHQQIAGSEIRIAEGLVTDYDYERAQREKGTRDDFYVDGVHFEYGSTDLTVPIGYRKNAKAGGYIRGNGQYVRISYITLETGRNVILRIEAPTSE